MQFCRLATLVAFFVLSACNIRVDRRAIDSCDMRIIPIEAQLPGADSALAPIDIFERARELQGADRTERTFENVVEQAVSPARNFVPGTRSNNLLFLSGGSHNGAYGAGYLLGWSEGPPVDAAGTPTRPRSLPTFPLVTGISTGSILATPAFLNDPVYGAEKFRNIDKERDVLMPYVRKTRGGDISKSSYLSIVKHSAVADLTPLRKWIEDYINPETLHRIALRAKEPAWLFVGVVDMESGKAVAIDLTDLATKHDAAWRAGDAARMQLLQRCYVNSIIASSSAPLAAKPVFINNRTYVDGGVRYGVFATAIRQGICSGGRKRAQGGTRASPDFGKDACEGWSASADSNAPRIFIIFHGTQEVEPWCDADTGPTTCEAFRDPRDIPEHPRPNWNLISLGLRSIDLMVNQLQRFSVTDLKQQFEPIVGRDNFHYTQIYPHHLKYRLTMEADGRLMTKTCEGWHEYDAETLKPVQFHPHYMKCLIAAGRAQGQKDNLPIN